MAMRRTLIELAYIASGLIGIALAAALAAWAVPLARVTIWQVAVVSMVVVALMGVGPLRTAWRIDRRDSLPGA